MSWRPAPFYMADAAAIRAVVVGTATPEQQKRAMAWVVNVAAGTYMPSFSVTDRDTAFAEGKRFVGLSIVELTKLSRKDLTALSLKRKGSQDDVSKDMAASST